MKQKQYLLLFVLCLIGATSLSAQTTDSYTEVDVEKYYDEESCLYYKLTTYWKEWEDIGAYYAAGKYAEVVDYYTDFYNTVGHEVVIPEKVTYKGTDYLVNKIGDKAFIRAYYLSYVSIPNTVEEIGQSAFYGLSLAVVDMGNAVKTIGTLAFGGCINLRAITLPASLTSINGSAFVGSGLKYILVESKNKDLFNCIYFRGDIFYDLLFLDECVVWTYTDDMARAFRSVGFKHVICEYDTTLDEDVNHDGQVNSLDVLKVYKYMQTH